MLKELYCDDQNVSHSRWPIVTDAKPSLIVADNNRHKRWRRASVKTEEKNFKSGGISCGHVTAADNIKNYNGGHTDYHYSFNIGRKLWRLILTAAHSNEKGALAPFCSDGPPSHVSALHQQLSWWPSLAWPMRLRHVAK